MNEIAKACTSEAVAKLREKPDTTSFNAILKHLKDLRAIYDNLEDKDSECAQQCLKNIAALNSEVKSQEEAQEACYRI